MRLAVFALGLALASSSCAEAPLETREGVSGADRGGDEGLAGAPGLAPLVEQAPPGASIVSYTSGGTGCGAPDSLSVLIAENGSSFLVIFDEMNLEHPPGPPVQNLNCVANIKVLAPAGWRFSVQTANTRGYAYLSEDQSAKIASMYFFSGIPAGGLHAWTLDGPHDDNYTFTDDVSSAGWSKCGGQSIFHVHTKLTLNAVHNTQEPAVLNATSADAKLVKTLNWRWEPC